MAGRGTWVAALAGVVLSMGCFASHEPPGDGPGEREHHRRFAGDWQVSAARGWALIPTVTVYRFQPDGPVDVVLHREGSYLEGEAAAWSVAGSDVTCRFGDRWWSEGAATLYVQAECSDGTASVARLDFPRSAAGNTSAPAPALAEPAGAMPLWAGPQGSFFRCTDPPEACVRF